MIPHRLISRSAALSPPDLLRAAAAVASRHGWDVHRPNGAGAGQVPDEARLIVSGAGLPGRCLLRVRVRPPGHEPAADVLARRAAASEHVVGVVDEPVSVRVRGFELDAVLLVRADGGALDALLARRESLRGGEAATILLGIAEGVQALHSRGWSNPDLCTAGVAFVGDGCPALDALDRVTARTPSSAVADADAFYGLARSLCLQVADGTGMMLLSAVEAGLRRGSWGSVEQSILTTVRPEPVDLTSGARSIDAAEGALVENGRTVRPARAATSGAPSRTPVRLRLVAALGSVMDALDDDPARALVRWLRDWLRRRPRVLIAGLVPIAAALAVVVLLPGSPAESASAESAASENASAPTDAPTPAERELAEKSPESSAEPVAVPADDPVDAARGLLGARLACFEARPTVPTCLAEVLDRTSTLVTDETTALGVSGAASVRDYSGAQLSLVERWGGAALVSVVPDAARTPTSKPASLLLVRSEAGWRLREVFP